MKSRKLPQFPVSKIIRMVPFLGFAFFLFLFPSPNVYFQSISSNLKRNDSIDVVLPPPPAIPQNVTGINAPDISAQGILIVDLPSNIIMHQKNADSRFHPASTTKIITALTALDHFKLDDILTVNRVENEGRTMGLLPGEKLSFESLLYGILVHSANDAAYTIAENYPGGNDKFIEMMNKKAGDYHLNNTHFTNPIGFDDDQTYTTPSDLASLAKIALSNKLIAKIVGTKNITVSDIDFSNFHELKNVNELLGKIKGVSGVKTGYTQNGGEILVSEVKKDGHEILIVLLKSNNRFEETVAMIDWVFNNFGWKNVTDIIPASR